MEIGYSTKKTLVPIIMEWVSKSRIQKHIAENAIFCMWAGDNGIQFNLSNLSQSYQVKHIVPDLQIYCLSFIQNIKPVLEAWCSKNNIQVMEMNIRFRFDLLVFNKNITLRIKQDDTAYREYLDNKST